jgi:general secretion pathway protein H
MLIVVALIGMLSALVSIATRPDPHQELERQARRVGVLLSLAAEESRMRQQDIVWESDLAGYRFVAESRGERAILRDDDLLRERDWNPPLTRIAVTDLASGGVQERLSRDAPVLRVAPAREWVQPRWRLEVENGEASVRLDFDGQGRAAAGSGGEKAN